VCPQIDETTLVKDKKKIDLNLNFLGFSSAWLKTNF
jgi:hypothetical protein